jgi:hypothetical protein
MTAQGEDLLAWLETAIARRELIARSAADSVGGLSWDGSERDVSARESGDTVADGVTYGDMWEPMQQEACDHIALNDPESVLRRCAADRKLIAAHPVTRDVITVQPDGTHGFGCAVCHHEDLLTVGDGWCDTLLALAEGYGWTGGER